MRELLYDLKRHKSTAIIHIQSQVLTIAELLQCLRWFKKIFFKLYSKLNLNLPVGENKVFSDISQALELHDRE